MSLWQNLLPPALGRKRPQTAVDRAFLDIDAGALMVPADFPYPPGSRPIRPFLGREVTNLGNARSDRQLFPSHSLMGRTLAHLTFRGQPSFARAATQDVSGRRVPPRGYRVRPWLFGGDTTGGARPGESSSGSRSDASGPCETC